MHTHHIIPLGNQKKKQKKKKQSSCHKSKVNIQSPTHHKQCLQKRTKPQIYIDGLKMDWSMDDGLYSCFQDWKLECELILDGELAEVVEPQKVNTLI